jgi:hypothetical protein
MLALWVNIKMTRILTKFSMHGIPGPQPGQVIKGVREWNRSLKLI